MDSVMLLGRDELCCVGMQKTNVTDVNIQEKSEKLQLTWSAAVDAEVVALCIADGLQSYCFTLAVPASLEGNTSSQKTDNSSFKLVHAMRRFPVEQHYRDMISIKTI